MNKRLMACVFAGLLAAPAIASARSSVVLGFHFGIPIYGPAPYYYPPYYYYPYYDPPPVYYYPAPAVQAPAAPAPPSEPSWYYCESARGYYPYVRECPGGWQRVPAAPPPAR